MGLGLAMASIHALLPSRAAAAALAAFAKRVRVRVRVSVRVRTNPDPNPAPNPKPDLCKGAAPRVRRRAARLGHGPLAALLQLLELRLGGPGEIQGDIGRYRADLEA